MQIYNNVSTCLIPVAPHGPEPGQLLLVLFEQVCGYVEELADWRVKHPVELCPGLLDVQHYQREKSPPVGGRFIISVILCISSFFLVFGIPLVLRTFHIEYRRKVLT